MSTDASIDEPTAHDGDREVLRADLSQGVDRTGVGDDRVGHALGPLLHEGLVVVDRQHLAAEPVELSGGGGAEPAEADHEHRCVVFDPVNQRWASLPVV